MPAAEGIVLILESQFDADTIPEAAIAGSDATDTASYEQRSVDVYVPSYLASQFWISYTINPAMLAPAHAPTKYVFFKLMLDGECVVSWGVGEAEEWKGKTMWAFFSGEDQGGWRAVDKRAFFFRPSGDDQDFDILAFRARGRRRACRQFDDMPPMGEKGFDLVNWGRLKEHNPQNFYQYALLDPVDQPYATFRYHVRGGPHVRAPCSDQHIENSDTIGPYAEPSSPTKLDSEHPVDSELDMSTILDPEPSVTGELLSASETTNNTEAQTEESEQSEKERISSVETVVRKRSLRTPTPLPLLINNTPPSSLRKRSGAKIKEWFGSIPKRRAIRPRSTSPIHPSLSHKTSSASLS
ncbi:hypothetical protein E4T47_04627 [Aureobasidium subglaciale]|nr:hypothetical protein E4T47_04627 [Aureobasidium subglaciale]